MRGVADTLIEVGVKKALDNSTSMSMTRSHVDLELLISQGIVETHIFITAWGECIPMLQYVAVLFCLPLFLDHRLVLGGGENTAAAERCPQGIKQVDIHLLD